MLLLHQRSFAHFSCSSRTDGQCNQSISFYSYYYNQWSIIKEKQPVTRGKWEQLLVDVLEVKYFRDNYDIGYNCQPLPNPKNVKAMDGIWGSSKRCSILQQKKLMPLISYTITWVSYDKFNRKLDHCLKLLNNWMPIKHYLTCQWKKLTAASVAQRLQCCQLA